LIRNLAKEGTEPMQNATPEHDHTDELTIHIARPHGLTNTEWEHRKQAISAAATPVIAEALGQCPERTWCHGVAGTPDHVEFHASAPIDLIPGRAANGETFGLSAWLVENRDDSGLQLVLDGHLPGSTASISHELGAAAAAVLLRATLAGESDDVAVDVRAQLLQFLDGALGGAR
jgi:hypothetical protein